MKEFGFILLLALFCIMIIAAVVVPMIVFAVESDTYLAINPTDQQLRELQCGKVCSTCQSCSCSGQPECIQVREVKFLGTIGAEDANVIAIRVYDMNMGKPDKFMQLTGLEYIKIEEN